MRLARERDLTDNQTGKIDPSYMAEVEAHTARREASYVRAQRALEAAQARHARAVRISEVRANKLGHEARVRKAWELVEERLRELRVLESLMTEVPSSRAHRGSGQAKHLS